MANKPHAVCRNGLHPLEGDNVHVYPNGVRRCRACLKAAERRRYARDREKRLRQHREYHARNADAINLRRRARRFGLTVAELQALGSACSVCGMEDGDPEAGRWAKLHVDHDHATGKVRGLLCHRCNAMLGHAQDDPERLRMAATYLEGGGE